MFGKKEVVNTIDLDQTKINVACAFPEELQARLMSAAAQTNELIKEMEEKSRFYEEQVKRLRNANNFASELLSKFEQ